MNSTLIERYCRLFQNLRTDREGDRLRPHKAVMLLSVIALCKNHHWLMDRHLIAPGPSRGNDYTKPIWLVSPLLDNRLEAHRACIEYKDRRIILPREERHHPSSCALAWRAEHLRS
jgi:predicted restriction endonuclease